MIYYDLLKVVVRKDVTVTNAEVLHTSDKQCSWNSATACCHFEKTANPLMKENQKYCMFLHVASCITATPLFAHHSVTLTMRAGMCKGRPDDSLHVAQCQIAEGNDSHAHV